MSRLDLRGFAVSVGFGGAFLLLAALPVRAQLSSGENPHGPLPEGMDCSACHGVEGWKPVKEELEFVHGAITGFELTGGHITTSCVSCHTDLRFDEPEVIATDCVSCHADIHESQMTATCATCHTTAAFSEVEAESLHLETLFPLTGSHLQITCESCHADATDGLLSGSVLDADCVACHQSDYDEAQSVDHVANAYPTTCTQCHGTDAWSGTTDFAHESLSGGFSLLGSHGLLRCASCHQVPGYDLLFPAPATQNDCVACHQSDYDAEHAGSGYPTTCLSCHTVTDWEADTEDVEHEVLSGGFALLGSHATQTCTACHQVPGYDLLFPAPATQNDCVACHQSDYDAEHAGSGYPTTCLSCHTVTDWEADTEDVEHEVLSGGFALLGSHATQTCTACHQVPGYDLLFPAPATQNDCVACHQWDYDAEHAGSGYPTTCLSCHTVTDWEADTEDVEHEVLSGGFALLGSHATQTCTACHQVPGYDLLFPAPATQNDCVACHQSDYDAEHAGSGYPTTCLSCHTVTDWEADTEDVEHEVLSGGFALLGSHATQTCTACHQVPGYDLLFPAPATQNDCVACHQWDYDAEHAGSGYPTTCLSCHTVTDWEADTEDVEHEVLSGGFALLGSHATQTCTACHQVPGYDLLFPAPATQNDCVACHQWDYDAEHAGSGYPTTCLSCHTDVTWSGATFDHDGLFFPIYSGKHRNEWSDCADCHTVPGDYSTFTCLTCHTPNQTNNDHSEVNGYVYESNSCLSCHPDGDN